MATTITNYGEYRKQGWSMFQVKVPHVFRHDGRRTTRIIACRPTLESTQAFVSQYSAADRAGREAMELSERRANDAWVQGRAARPWAE